MAKESFNWLQNTSLGTRDCTPDYSRAILLTPTVTSTNPFIVQSGNQDTRIWKINVPCYLFAEGAYNINQDTGFALSWNPEYLKDGTTTPTDNSDNKLPCYVYFVGKPSDSTDGGSSELVPILPTTTTYMCLCGAALGYYIHAIPFACVPNTSIIPKSKYIEQATDSNGTSLCVTTAWKSKSGFATGKTGILNCTHSEWNNILGSPDAWKANFPEIYGIV